MCTNFKLNCENIYVLYLYLTSKESPHIDPQNNIIKDFSCLGNSSHYWLKIFQEPAYLQTPQNHTHPYVPQLENRSVIMDQTKKLMEGF